MARHKTAHRKAAEAEEKKQRATVQAALKVAKDDATLKANASKNAKRY